jgi:hypothetical protein
MRDVDLPLDGLGQRVAAGSLGPVFTANRLRVAVQARDLVQRACHASLRKLESTSKPNSVW